MAGATRIVFLVILAIGLSNAEWQPIKSTNENVVPSPEAAVPGAERNAKFINFRNIMTPVVSSNEIDTDEIRKSNDDAPTSVLSGIYTDCLSQLSLTCVQKKVMVFLDRLGRMESFGLLGDFMSVVRTNKNVEPAVKEEDLKDDGDIEVVAARFFDSHIVRVSLPSWSDNVAEGKAVGSSIDISLPKTEIEEGRKKKKGGGKMMKKLMMMLGMAAAAKMALMVPLAIMLIKIKAIKALIIGKIALMISKFLLIKKLLASKKGGGGGEKHVILVHADHGHGGGGGGGGHGGGGGGHGGGSDSYGPPSGGGGGYSGGGGSYSSGGGHGGDSGWSSGGGGGGGGGGHSSGGGGGWSGGGGGSSGGWGRSMGTVEDPQMIAYRGQYKQTN